MRRRIAERFDVRSRAEVRAMMRRVLRQPGCAAIVMFLLLFSTLLMPGGRLETLAFWPRLLVNTLWAAVFLGLLYGPFPDVLWAGLRRNLPVLWITTGFLTPVVLIEAAVNGAAFGIGQSFPGIAWYVLSTLIMVVLATTLALLAFRDFFAGMMEPGADLPAFLPTPVEECGLQSALSPEVRGQVQRIEAESQYIRVHTTRGTELVRMSLAQAEALVPRGQGLRIHRSHWIRISNIAEIFFDRGNPRLIDIDGQQLPISRSKLPAVRRALERNRRRVEAQLDRNLRQGDDRHRPATSERRPVDEESDAR